MALKFRFHVLFVTIWASLATVEATQMYTSTRAKYEAPIEMCFKRLFFFRIEYPERTHYYSCKVNFDEKCALSARGVLEPLQVSKSIYILCQLGTAHQ